MHPYTTSNPPSWRVSASRSELAPPTQSRASLGLAKYFLLSSSSLTDPVSRMTSLAPKVFSQVAHFSVSGPSLTTATVRRRRSIEDDGVPWPEVPVVLQQAVGDAELPDHRGMLDGHEVHGYLEQILFPEDGKAAPSSSPLLEWNHPIVLAESFDAGPYLDHDGQAIVPGHEGRFGTGSVSGGTRDHCIKVPRIDGYGAEVEQHLAPLEFGRYGPGVHFQHFFGMSHVVAVHFRHGLVAAFDDSVLFGHVFCGVGSGGRFPSGVEPRFESGGMALVGLVLHDGDLFCHAVFFLLLLSHLVSERSPSEALHELFVDGLLCLSRGIVLLPFFTVGEDVVRPLYGCERLWISSFVGMFSRD
eukprot:scaffold1997_cov318-Pavlova_lutheri.AAC.6